MLLKGRQHAIYHAPSLSHTYTHRSPSPLCMPETLKRILLSSLVSLTAEYFVVELFLDKAASNINSRYYRCQHFKYQSWYFFSPKVITLSKTQEIQNKRTMDSLQQMLSKVSDLIVEPKRAHLTTQLKTWIILNSLPLSHTDVFRFPGDTVGRGQVLDENPLGCIMTSQETQGSQFYPQKERQVKECEMGNSSRMQFS